jgi:hypothetical protein
VQSVCAYRRLNRAGQQAPGAVALVTERAPASLPTSLLPWTTESQYLRVSFLIVVRDEGVRLSVQALVGDSVSEVDFELQ